jgi:hypothetical protein
MLIIYLNILHILGSKMLQYKCYKKKSTMTKLRMIPEPYIMQAISLKL